MDWLNQWFWLEVPPHARLQSAAIGFREVIPWWLAVLLVLAVAAGAVFLYARERPGLGRFRRGLLALLRTAAIVLILALLMRPVLLATFVGERPRGVVLLLDNSLSMKQQDRRLTSDDRFRVALAQGLVPADTPLADEARFQKVSAETWTDPSRMQLVQGVLANQRLQFVEGLKQHGPLHAFLFGAQLTQVPEGPGGAGVTPGAIQNSLKAAESRTALANALHDLLQRKDRERPAAVVVVTDGLDNGSRYDLAEVARKCGQAGVPLHVYGVGSAEGGLLQIKEVAVADTVFYDDEVTVPVRWRSQGFTKGEVEITLTLQGKVVARKDFPVRPGEEARDFLKFTPTKSLLPEPQGDLVASVRLKNNDAFKDSWQRPVRLADRKVKVLYVENVPRWEYKFLQTALLRDRRVEARFFLAQADPKALQSWPFLKAFPTREQLFGFDLLILGDVPPSVLTPDRVRWVEEFVKEGGGLIAVAGRQHFPADYAEAGAGGEDKGLLEVLPVEFAPVRFKVEADARPQPYLPLLTAAGERALYLNLADDVGQNQKQWHELPGFYWHYPVTKTRPGATTLLAHPAATLEKRPMPLWVIHHYGRGQALFVGTEETWRWRFNAEDQYFSRLWGQLVYQMGLPHLLGHANRVEFALEHGEAQLDRPGHIYVRLFDAEYQPLTDPQVIAWLTLLDAREGPARTREIALQVIDPVRRPGEYRVLLPNDVAGRFELKLDRPEPASFEFRVVLPPRHELQPAALAEESLRLAARLSGGRYYREEDLHRLVSDIVPRTSAFTQRQEVLLWHPLTMLLFVGLLTAEWVLRKFSHLS
jgi:uncharacterized membrane protein